MTSLKHLSVHNNAIDFRHLTNPLKEHMLTVIRALHARRRKKDPYFSSGINYDLFYLLSLVVIKL